MSATRTRTSTRRARGDHAKRDPYQEVTDRIMAALEAGTVPWHKPWASVNLQPRSMDGRFYTGINAILLALSGFSDPRWGTFQTVKRHGGTVRKGERGTLVVFFKPLIVKDKETDESRAIPFLRYFHVFNAAQCDGLDLEPIDTGAVHDNPAIDAAELVYRQYPDAPRLVHGAQGAFYRPSIDVVSMPDRERFESSDAYYLTLWHELVHSTGHERRLNRADLKDARVMGDASYSREELTAEMGASMIAARVGVVAPDIDQSAAYIAGWLRALRNDKKLVISAASRAQKAADLILGPQSAESDEE